MSTPSSTPQELTFEAALARLEAIATRLERDEVPLAEMMTLCSEATVLTQQCRRKLIEAEGKLEQLVELANGELRREPFAED
jgi:exodeoxyribonuclease VII small subunit